jgi:hypothetical protein
MNILAFLFPPLPLTLAGFPLAESPLPNERARDSGSPYRLQTARAGATRGVPGLPWAQQYDYGDVYADGGGFGGGNDDESFSEPSPFVPSKMPGHSGSQLNARANQLANRHRVSVDNDAFAVGLAANAQVGNPSAGSQEYIQKLRSELFALIKVSEKLEEENANLKEVNMRATMDDVIASQRERMMEREKASDDLVSHWRGKYEKLEEMISSGYVEQLEEQNTDLSARIHGLEMEKVDLTLSLKEKEAKIAELQKRNVFLEKYARVYPTKDAGMGTEGVQRIDVGIQAPHAVVQHRARAMAPEGVPSESLYTYGAVDATGPHFGGMHRGHQERTYDLLPQVTVPHGAHGANGAVAGYSHLPGAATGAGTAGTSSVGVAGPGAPGIPGTKESRRRAVAQEPLLGPDGQPRQIAFYSGSDQEINPRQQSEASISPDERRLLEQIGLEAAVEGEAVVYRHPRSGFMFKLSRTPEDDEDSAAGFDLEYEPLAWGRAKAAIGNCARLQDQLLLTASFRWEDRTNLLNEIGGALENF